MYNLGKMADVSSADLGIDPNYGEALKWYQKAADAGNTEAQQALASPLAVKMKMFSRQRTKRTLLPFCFFIRDRKSQGTKPNANPSKHSVSKSLRRF
jgi:TPR repeat protein